MKTPAFFILFAACILQASCQNKTSTAEASHTKTAITTDSTKSKGKNPYYSRTDTTVLHVTDAEWKKVLPADVYAVSREKDTERAFTGKFWDYTGKGTYYCAACGNPLFRSDAKFASSCGWPSFFEQLNPKSVKYAEDNSFGTTRTEVLCARCGGHLGHIFDDGPPPSGKRYCMNSIALDFEPDSKLNFHK